MPEERKKHAQKIMILGVDGMDPRYTRYMVDQGKMPNVAEYIKRGACREDLVLLGGHHYHSADVDHFSYRMLC